MKFSGDLQTLLPFGYIYLVILGIVKESFFYYQLGINILKNSTIMDILLSPIAEFTSNPFTLVFIILLFIFHYKLPSILSKKGHKKFVQKALELKSVEGLSAEESKNYYNGVSIRILIAMLLCFFVGTGIGGGYFLKKRIHENKIHYDYKLNYNSGESEQIELINTNSLYYFYLAKNNKAIKIAPIASIKSIELTNNKRLK